MRQTLKVSLSLLITLVVFAVFLVVAYTGFFYFIQTGFFRPRVQEEYLKQLNAISKGIEDYHKRNIERFSPAAGQDFVSRAFLTQQSEEDIFRRENFFGKLLENFPNLQFVRFIGKEGKKIHFSTLNSDIRKQNRYRKVYYNLNDTGSSISGLKLVTKPEEKYKVIIDGKNQRFIYSLPVIDKYNVYRGNVSKSTYDMNFPYNLPYKTGLSFRIDQGYDGTFTHQNKKALDFKMPIGTPVTAIRDGKVILVEDTFDKHGETADFNRYANYKRQTIINSRSNIK